ncbi:M90 family metallopeptidase [Ideonella sp.]|uniref:M90 family metallopeptidase n=1 Tax=Ideonella sp. TaxID=1929293 RepID=UPI002B494F2C|nr:M90 family metallopeptidase [Ideonella sp.]HJV71021.1 M90 family metallopeptidase [Ideonella sp.]
MPLSLDALTMLLGTLLFAALLAGGLWGPRAWRAWRRRRVVQQPFPAAWRTILRRRMPVWRRLPADLQLQLKRHMQVFLAEKPFIGCNGLEVSEEMRVLVAAQACLLLLNRPSDYFPRLRQVLLYPTAYWAHRREGDGSGVQHERREARSGESWVEGQVILSWPDVLEGAADPGDGQNLVIHEFAHQLDQERGRATGAPFLGERARYARWAAVMSTEYRRLREQLGRGEQTLLSPYAATEPAEFFAVASEVFFEQPHAMAERHPSLYDELARYYRVDPRAWG